MIESIYSTLLVFYKYLLHLINEHKFCFTNTAINIMVKIYYILYWYILCIILNLGYIARHL